MYATRSCLYLSTSYLRSTFDVTCAGGNASILVAAPNPLGGAAEIIAVVLGRFWCLNEGSADSGGQVRWG